MTLSIVPNISQLEMNRARIDSEIDRAPALVPWRQGCVGWRECGPPSRFHGYQGHMALPVPMCGGQCQRVCLVPTMTVFAQV